MIVCPVCNTPNQHLKITCSSCGSYIQKKVDTLNLFETIWKLLETPKKAFHTIAVSQHKNYSLLLGALAGYAYVALIFWFMKAGDSSGHLIELLGVWIALSPFVGLIIFFLHLTYGKILSRAMNITVSFRNLMAVVAYSLIPLIISAFLIFPIELITFGVFLFTRAPNPFTLKPSSALFLFSLDAMLGLWSFILYIIGMKILLDCSLGKVFVFSLLSIGITVITIAGVFMLLPIS